MATGNITIDMVNQIWELLNSVVDAKSGLADEKLGAATSAAQAVDVKFDKSAGASIAGMISGLTTPPTPPMPAPSSPMALPDPMAARVISDAERIQRQSMGAIAPMADYGAPPIFDASDEFTMEGLRSLYDNDRMEMLQALKQSFEEFMDKYFPPGGYFDKATAWLERAIDANGTGIPVVVENAMWERDRARLTAEAVRAEDEALTAWAGRGYTLPPGALVHGMHTIRAGLTNALSAQSRDIAIKVTDVHVENARFAVGQAAQIRSQAISAAVEYVKALMVSPQYVGQWLSTLMDGRAKMVGAQADVYRTRAGVAVDVFKVDAQTKLETYKTASGVEVESVKAGNTVALENTRIGADVDRQMFSADLERYSTSEKFRLEQAKMAEERLLRFFEADMAASTKKAEMLSRAGELTLRASQGDADVEMGKAKLKVDAAMSAAQMVATQAAAALNNLQLGATVSNSSQTSSRT